MISISAVNIHPIPTNLEDVASPAAQLTWSEMLNQLDAEKLQLHSPEMLRTKGLESFDLTW